MAPYKMRRTTAWTPYVRKIADMIGLRDWDIEVSERKPDIANAAEVICVSGRRAAIIKLSNYFMTTTRDSQRYLVTHELVHCHFASMHNFLDATLEGPHYTAYNHAYEYGVDATAAALAPFLPLPPRRKRDVVPTD